MNDPDVHSSNTREDDTRRLVRTAIREVAPDAESEVADLDPDVDLWLELQLDSMDHLAVMTRLAAATGVEIPERAYPELLTVAAIARYLAAHSDGA